MNWWPLLGIALVVLGFMLRLNPALVVVVYTAFNQVMFGLPVQISGVVKRVPVGGREVIGMAVFGGLALLAAQRSARARTAITSTEGMAAARFPRLTVIVAHMGAFESEAFLALLDAHPNLYVDTTMALAPAAGRYVGADPDAIADAALVRYQDRILFGSDFPLVPYDYDEERRWAWERDLPDVVRRKIFHDNAARLLGGG